MQKDQPGYMIFAPVTAKFASANPSDPSSWRRLEPGEKHKVNEVVRSKMIGARPAYVWDISLTAGDPIPELPAPKLLEGQAPAGLWDGLVAQIEGLGFTVERVADESEIGGADGLTRFASRQVSVRTNFAEANQVTTLAHELAHVMMHDPADEDARQHRGIREVEAESVALMVCAAHGMDTSQNTIPYVAGWATSVKDIEAAEVVKTTGERVRRTVTAILDTLDTTQINDGNPPGLNREALKRNPPRRRAARNPRTTEPQAARAGDAVSAGRGL